MGRPRKKTFTTEKMLSSRVELNDYIKFEGIMYDHLGKKPRIQELMNSFIRSCISGSIKLDTNNQLFIGGE